MRSEGLVGGELISEDILIVDIPKDELMELLRVIERKRRTLYEIKRFAFFVTVIPYYVKYICV